jgi:hypothetical protein
MHGQAYLRKGIIPHLGNALEEYLWLGSQVPTAQLDTVPPGRTTSVRTQILDLAVDLDLQVYPALIALIEGNATPPPLDPDTVTERRTAWATADLMVAMKQIRYRFQATEALLEETSDAIWGHPTGAPTPLAQATFALWRMLLDRLAPLADTVAGLEHIAEENGGSP